MSLTQIVTAPKPQEQPATLTAPPLSELLPQIPEFDATKKAILRFCRDMHLGAAGAHIVECAVDYDRSGDASNLEEITKMVNFLGGESK